MVLTWAAPTSSNGDSVDSYSIQLLKKDASYITIDDKCDEYVNPNIPSTATTCTITMAEIMTAGGYTASDAGTYIQMKVLATNTFGSSPYSTTNANSVVIQSAPIADVTTVTLAKTKNTITATWTTSPTAAADYGYAPITEYLYRYKAAADSWPADWTTATSVSATAPLTAILSVLTPQTAYNFQIIAKNQFGNGPETPTTTWNITTSDKPATMSAPVVNLEASGTTVNITFTQPAYYNNSITGYTIHF